MPSELVQKFVILDGPVSGMRSLAVGGTSERQLARLGTTIALGHFTVEKPLVSFEGEDGGVLLGKGTVVGTLLLEHFVVTFDVRHNRVRFSRESRVPITPPTLRMLGLGMRRSGDSMEVWAVHPNSNAKSLGVLEGSLVHEINGRPAIALYGTSEWDDLLETADKITLRFAPPGGDAAQTVAVEVLKLLPSARGETGETAGG